RKLLQFADAFIDALHDVRGARQIAEPAYDRLFARRTVPGLGKDLDGIDVVVAIDDESGQAIGLAEGQAIGIGAADYLTANLDGLGQAPPREIHEIVFGGELLTAQ